MITLTKNNYFCIQIEACKKKYYKKKKFYSLSFLSAKNKAIINITVQANTDIVFNSVVSAPQISKNKAPIIMPIA